MPILQSLMLFWLFVLFCFVLSIHSEFRQNSQRCYIIIYQWFYFHSGYIISWICVSSNCEMMVIFSRIFENCINFSEYSSEEYVFHYALLYILNFFMLGSVELIVIKFCCSKIYMSKSINMLR